MKAILILFFITITHSSFGISIMNGPGAPTNLTIKATSPTSIRINWTDNANNEEGFEIFRCESSKNRCNDGNSTWYGFNKMDAVAANGTSYEDKNLEPGGNYYYKISAYNRAGRATSDIINATTSHNKLTLSGRVSDSSDFSGIIAAKVTATAGVTISKSAPIAGLTFLVKDNAPVQNIKIGFDMSPSDRYGNFEIDLIHPDGTSVKLAKMSTNGSSFIADYPDKDQPLEPFSKIIGKPMNGNWTVEIRGSQGTLNRFYIDIISNLETATNNNGYYRIPNLSPGYYRVRVEAPDYVFQPSLKSINLLKTFEHFNFIGLVPEPK